MYSFIIYQDGGNMHSVLILIFVSIFNRTFPWYKYLTHFPLIKKTMCIVIEISIQRASTCSYFPGEQRSKDLNKITDSALVKMKQKSHLIINRISSGIDNRWDSLSKHALTSEGNRCRTRAHRNMRGGWQAVDKGHLLVSTAWVMLDNGWWADLGSKFLKGQEDNGR